MKREGVWREIERGRYRPRSQTLRSRLYEQTKHVETIILSERCQSSHGIRLFHISTNIEIGVVRQCIWQTVKNKSPHVRVGTGERPVGGPELLCGPCLARSRCAG